MFSHSSLNNQLTRVLLLRPMFRLLYFTFFKRISFFLMNISLEIAVLNRNQKHRLVSSDSSTTNFARINFCSYTIQCRTNKITDNHVNRVKHTCQLIIQIAEPKTFEQLPFQYNFIWSLYTQFERSCFHKPISKINVGHEFHLGNRHNK